MRNIHIYDIVYIFPIRKINLISRFQNLETSLAYMLYIEYMIGHIVQFYIFFLQAVNFGITYSASNITYHAKLMRDVYCHID